MTNNVEDVDVLIVGGGSSGIAAAIGASRNGAKVILIEKSSQLGGKATQSVVGTICGAYYRSTNKTSKYVTNGFAKEFCETLKKASKTEPIAHYQHELHFLPYNPLSFSLIADDFLAEAKNTQCFLHAIISDISIVNNKITTVEFINFKEKKIVRPKFVIDCTGESTVSKIAGIPTLKQDEYQASAVVFSLENVVPSEPVKLSLAMLRAVSKAITDKELPADLDKVSIVPGSIRDTHLMIKLALPTIVNDTAENKSEIERFARKAAASVADQLIKRVSNFANAHIGFVASEAGTRTGALSEGKYILQKEDVLNCAKFEDGIAKGAWPIELWESGKNAHLEFFPHDKHYEIPLRALESKTIGNLYFAGRIISATNHAIASARVIGICLNTGFAAGTAAALQTKGYNSSEIIKLIRKEQVDR
ncbi:FAD-dependent oxidoreductase [Owenweeksia hongkongensis]|uniref:FAD-dependent oxidoreductase n=1 Tax=Owenweeksia hongkongensis TaxID=253245 RepID=UPI003A8EF44F